MKSPKILFNSIGTFLAIIGVSAFISGLSLMLNPEGGMGLSTGLLNNSPFEDFFIPGIFLFVMNGIVSLIVSFLAFRNHMYTGIGTILLGALMIVWITTQVYWIGWTSWLQPTFLAVGVIELGIGIYLNEKHSNHHIFKGHHGTHAH